MTTPQGLGSLLDGDPHDVIAYLDGEATTRGALQRAAERLAAVLADRGLAGRAVGVRMPNRPETVAAWFGIWRAGATFVPLNPRAPDAEVARAIDAAGVAAVVAEVPLDGAPSVLEGSAGVRRACDGGDAIVQFTSGTTGPPKPVVLRHDTVSELLDSVIASLRGDRAGRARMPNIVPVPLALWAGIYQVLFALKLGVPVVLMDRFDPAAFARLVREYGIRSSVLPPAALVMLLHDPQITSLEPLRYVRSVSAPLSPAHARRFHERFGIAILNGYGQTELGGEAIGWTAPDWKQHGLQKVGSVGRPHAAFEARVRTRDATPAPPDEVGELEIRTTSPRPPDASLEERLTDDGWLRTGDLARIDADGFVWIEGRVSDMINRGGLKVFPDEVEELMRAHEAVEDVAVAGVADERVGEVPWAFVVARPGAAVDTESLQRWCRDRMAAYKIPAGITVVDVLPRNDAGKVLRAALRPLASRPG
jgi:acyl-CoA synthetase (AMP-forming)/AMP-acid ligase II